MITEQNHPTINTPALKQFAIGKLTREQLLAFPAGTERAQRIHVVNARVKEIHAQGNYVYLAGGRGFGYRSLLIATGSAPTGLPASLPGRDFDGVLTLHRLNDYLDLRRRLSGVDEAVVIGGGPHAVETVMSLLYWGVDVHWLIRSETFLPRMLDRPASDMVIERIRRAGASVYTETEVMGIVGRVGVVAGVVTNQHQLLPAHLLSPRWRITAICQCNIRKVSLWITSSVPAYETSRPPEMSRPCRIHRRGGMLRARSGMLLCCRDA